MKIQIVSDLHLDFAPFTQKILDDTEVIVVAGDILNAVGFSKYTQRVRNYWNSIPNSVVKIYVPGNHDFYHPNYGQTLPVDEVTSSWDQLITGINLTLDWMHNELPDVVTLDMDTFDYKHVRFHGTTLWSPCNSVHANQFPRALSDFHAIPGMTVDNMRRLFVDRAFWINGSMEAAQAHGLVNVAITHFMPTPKSVATKFNGHPLNPYFYGNVETAIPLAKLWIHGHTHCSADYMFDETRVVCNPRGYEDENKGDFSSTFAVEL